MLERAFGIEFGMTGKMHLAIFADDPRGLVGEDAGVEMMPVRGQFGITEAHGHLVRGGALEQL